MAVALSVEFAPGFYIPAERYDEFMAELKINPAVAEAVTEIILERQGDPLTDDLCIFIPHWFQASIERKLASLLLEKAASHEAQSRKTHHMAGFALEFGKVH